MSLNEARQIGGVEEIHTPDSILYEIRYIVPESKMKKFMPVIGTCAPWAPQRAYIRKIRKTWLARDAWNVVIQAEKYDDENFIINYKMHPRGLLNEVILDFDVSDIYFQLEWFGCRIATAADCGPEGLMGTIYDHGIKRYYNISGKWAVPGDFIANNATPEQYFPNSVRQISAPTAGTPDYSKSPFNEPIDPKYIGQTVKTRLFRCVFHSSRAPYQFDHFTGVNGKFSAKCRPDNVKQGAWKALRQHVHTVPAGRGKSCTRVERLMQEAPLGLTWNSEKNGGIWKW